MPGVKGTAMSTITAPATYERPTPSDPYYYGWRDISTEGPDGKAVTVRVPLTLEDCLHPQMGDVIVESSLHEQILTYLATILRTRTACDPRALVLSDTGVYWDEPEIGHHCPDVAVISDVPEKRADWSAFHVAEQGTRPRLIIEVVSPNTRTNDVQDKVEQYHQVRVPFYVIVDRINEQWKLAGYQWTPTHYLPMPSDENGRLWLEPVGLWLGLKGDRVALYDGATGQEIPDYAMLEERHQAAEARIQELEKALKERTGDSPNS